MSVFDLFLNAENTLKYPEIRDAKILSILEDIKKLSNALLLDYENKNYEHIKLNLKKLIELDKIIVNSEKEDALSYTIALDILNECTNSFKNFDITNNSKLNLLINHINLAVNTIETRETALMIRDKKVLSDFMALMQKDFLDESDISSFELDNHIFLTQKPNKKIAKIMLKKLVGKQSVANDYNSFVYMVAYNIIKEYKQTRRDPGRERNQVEYNARLILNKFPNKKFDIVYSDLVDAMEKSKEEIGRHGR